MILCEQEEQNRGKPNWEHLNDELHVLITVEDTENRAKVKLQRAVDEIKKLLVPAVIPPSMALLFSYLSWNCLGGCTKNDTRHPDLFKLQFEQRLLKEKGLKRSL